MKRAFVLIALAGASMIAHADPIGYINLDQNQPTYTGGHYSWDYTISVSDGSLNDLQSVVIDDVGGVLSVHAPTGWDAFYAYDGPGLSDVIFSRDWSQEGNSENGFYINSIYGSTGSAPYMVTYSDHHYGDDPVVGAATATPEPGTFALVGLALIGVGSLTLRRS